MVAAFVRIYTNYVSMQTLLTHLQPLELKHLPSESAYCSRSRESHYHCGVHPRHGLPPTYTCGETELFNPLR